LHIALKKDINPGWYQFTGLPAGTYTLTASKPCYGIIPSSRSVTITDADVTEKNFTARLQSYSIQRKRGQAMHYALS